MDTETLVPTRSGNLQEVVCEMDTSGNQPGEEATNVPRSAITQEDQITYGNMFSLVFEVCPSILNMAIKSRHIDTQGFVTFLDKNRHNLCHFMWKPCCCQKEGSPISSHIVWKDQWDVLFERSDNECPNGCKEECPCKYKAKSNTLDMDLTVSLFVICVDFSDLYGDVDKIRNEYHQLLYASSKTLDEQAFNAAWKRVEEAVLKIVKTFSPSLEMETKERIQKQKDKNVKAPTDSQRNEKREKDWTEVTGLNDFIKKAQDLMHFKVRRDNCSVNCFSSSCSTSYDHHFIVVHNESGNAINILHYTEAFFGAPLGVGEARMEQYQLTEESLKPLVDFTNKNVKCHYNAQALVNLGYSTLKPSKGIQRDIYARLLKRVSERDYHTTENNCEHIVNDILYGSKSTDVSEETRTLAFFCGVGLSNIKSIGIIFTMMFAFLGIALGAVVRRAYVRLIIAVIISHERHENRQECTNELAKNIIQAASDRLNEVKHEHYFQDDNDSFIITNFTDALHSEYVCGIAKKLGEEALIKTSVYSSVAWIILQTAFLFIYINMHLIPMRKIYKLQERKDKFCKYVVVEVLGGYIPICVSVGIGLALQYYLSKPSVAFYSVSVLVAVVTRIVTTAVVSYCFERGCTSCCSSCSSCSCNCSDQDGYCDCLDTACFKERCNEKCPYRRCYCFCFPAVFFLLVILTIFFVFVGIHYSEPDIDRWEPF